MSWLSPVSWAKWTWTAVRGGEGEEDEEGHEASEERQQLEEEEEEEEERSQSYRQVLCFTLSELEEGAFSHVCPCVCVHLSG